MRRWILPAVVVASVGCDPVIPEPFGAEGIPWEVAEHRARTITDLRYAYALTVPREREMPVEGSVLIRFEWSDPESFPVVLDFLHPEERVRSVTVNGREIEWEPRNDHIIIPASRMNRDGANEVQVDFVAGDEALNRRDSFLYTLFVPDRAHFSLPIFDQPNLKGRFSLTLDVPEGWNAVANGAELGGSEQGGPRAFAETPPISSYLFSFAVGDFAIEEAVRDGRTYRMLHRETDVESIERNRDAIFDLHATALTWLEEYTGIEYPFEKFDFVAVPSFQYGGMEHPGAILYRSGSLFLDETATQNAFLGRASLIAHETAHMWFGDLVTMEWFNDVWLKEVFANFMAAKIVEPSFPEVNHRLRFFLAHHPRAYAIDRSEGAHPVLQPLDNLQEAGTLYGPIIYQKAPVMMEQLEALIGEEAFRDGIREYLSVHSFGNATWSDLITVLDQETERDLRAWSRLWIESPGRPVVTSRVGTDEDGQLTMAMVFQDDPMARNRFWPQAMDVALGYGDSVPVVRIDLDGAAVGLEDRLGMPEPRWILPGAGGVGYGQMHVHGGALERFVEDLPGLEDPVVRGVGYQALYDALLDRWIGADRYLEVLLEGLIQETDEQIVQRLLGNATSVYARYLSDEERTVWTPRLEARFWRGVQESPSSTRKGAWFSAYRSVVRSDEGRDRLHRIWNGSEEVAGLQLSEQDRTGLAAALALLGAPDAEEILRTQLERIENPDRKARLTFLLPALSDDPAERERFFASLADPENRSNEPWALAGLGYLNHPVRADDGIRHLPAALEMLEEIQRTGDIFFPGRWLDAALSGHGSMEAASIVRGFLDERPDYPPRLRAKILQAADPVFRAAELKYGSGVRVLPGDTPEDPEDQR